VRADVEEHVRDEHSTFTWLLEPLLERSSFEIQATDYTDDGIFAKYLARRRWNSPESERRIADPGISACRRRFAVKQTPSHKPPIV